MPSQQLAMIVQMMRSQPAPPADVTPAQMRQGFEALS
jgi:hypothetical protein